jgi:hypothetical protein
MKMGKLPKKTDADAVKEIDDIISGKKKGMAANIVRQFIKARKAMGDDPEFIRQELIRQFKIKYGLLQEGKTAPGEMLKQSEEEIKMATKDGT